MIIWKEADVQGTNPADGKVLHANGKPLTEAHTDNFGLPGQGPLEVFFNPPQEDVDEAKIQQRWVGALKQVGGPAVTKVLSLNSQLPKVYGQEYFDFFSMEWADIGVNNIHWGNSSGVRVVISDTTQKARFEATIRTH